MSDPKVINRNPFNVKPKQVWRENDRRSRLRTVRVISIDDTHATVETLTPARAGAEVSSRRTRIRLNRFNEKKTGYSLQTEAP